MPQTFGANCVLEEPAMEIETSYLGKIQVSDEDVIDFPEGLIGLPDLKRFVLLEDKEKKPFQWLQSIDNLEVAFVVLEPKWLVPNIVFKISENLAATLEIDSPEKYQALSIVTIPDDPRLMTANLMGPILFNPDVRKAAQIINDDYPVQFRILEDPAES